MPKSRTKHRQPTQTLAFQRARAQISQSGNVRRGLGSYKLYAPISELRQTVREFVAHPAYRPLIWPNLIARDYAHLAGNGLHTTGDISRELEWVVQTLLPFSEPISSFLEMRRECEISLLLGDREEQEKRIRELEAEFGVSLWLFQTKMNFAQRTIGLAEQRRLTAELLSNPSIPILVKFIVHWLLFRSEQSVSLGDFSRALDKRMPHTGFHKLARVVLGVCPDLDMATGGEALAFTDFMPLVDRYIYAIAVVQAYVACAQSHEDVTRLARPLFELAQNVNDPALQRLALVCGAPAKLLSSSADLLPALDLYSQGDNEGTMRLTEPIITQSGSVDALHMYLRAAAYSGVEPQLNLPDGSLLAEISADLHKVITFSPDAPAASSRLAKLAISNSHCTWSSTLDLVTLRQGKDERVFRPSRQQIVDALRAFQETPVLAFCFEQLGAANPYLSALMMSKPDSVTCASAKELLGPDNSLDKVNSLAATHFLKLKVAKALRTSDAIGALNALESVYRPADSGFQHFETALLMAECLLQANQLERCAQVCADTFLKSNYLGAVLPISNLVEALLKHERGRPRTEYFLGKLPITIVFDIYSRFISSSRDPERADAFKDFLDAQGVQRASDLLARASEFPRDQFIYFLRYVCIPEVLDQSLVLETSRDVEDERAKLLVQLTELFTRMGDVPPPALMEELQAIRTRQVIRDTTLQLDQSKIFVDGGGIKKSLDSQLREEWQQYKLLSLRRNEESHLDDVYKVIQKAVGDKFTVVSLTLPLTERNKLFEHMVANVRDMFATNKVFGLDANLSTNIRHGFILRELRKPFVAARLVTNRPTQSAEYEPNNYWLDRIGYGADRGSVSNALNRFSAAVDAEIDLLVTKTLRIKSEQAPEGLFDFVITHPEVQLLQRAVDDAESHDEFFDIVTKYLWQRTNDILSEVRSELLNSTLNRLQSAINNLEMEIEALSGRWQYSQLLTEINLIRPEARSAVQRVASWFTLSESREYKDYPLRIAFDAGVATVSSYYNRVKIDASLSSKEFPLLSGWTLPYFTRLFSIIVENAAVHSGIQEGRLGLWLDAVATNDSFEFKIVNQLSTELDKERLLERVAKLNAEFGRDASSEYVGKEGKSGFPKIWKILTHDLRRSHELFVSVEDGPTFAVQILMNSEGIAV